MVLWHRVVEYLHPQPYTHASIEGEWGSEVSGGSGSDGVGASRSEQPVLVHSASP